MRKGLIGNVIKWASAIFAVFYIVFFFLTFGENANNIPRGDDFVQLNFLASHINTGPFTNIKDSFEQYYEQRVFIARFFYIYSYKVFSIINLKYLMLLGNILFLSISYFIFTIPFRQKEKQLLPHIIIAILLFNPWIYENMLWSFSLLQYQSSLLFSILAAYFIFIKRNVLPSLFFSLLSTISVGSGNFIIPVILFVLVLDFRKNKKLLSYYFIGSLPILFLFYYNYEFLNGFFNSSFSSYVLGFFAFIGGKWSYDLSNGIILPISIGLVLVLAILGYFLFDLRQKYLKLKENSLSSGPWQSFAFAMIIKMLLIGLAASVNRVLFDKIENVFYGRYQLFVTILIVSFFLLFYVALKPAYRKYIVALVIPVCLCFGNELLLQRRSMFEKYYTHQACMNFLYDRNSDSINTLSTSWLELDKSLFVVDDYLLTKSFTENLLRVVNEKPTTELGDIEIKNNVSETHLIEKQIFKYSKFEYLPNTEAAYTKKYDGAYLLFQNEDYAFLIPFFEKNGKLITEEFYPYYYQNGVFDTFFVIVENGEFQKIGTKYSLDKNELKVSLVES